MKTTANGEGRTCSKCGVFKPHADMTKNKQRPFGTRSECKACKALWYKTKYYDKNKTSILDRTAKYYQDNKEAMRAAAYRYRAKDPLKHKARVAVSNAVRSGKFEKADCQE